MKTNVTMILISLVALTACGQVPVSPAISVQAKAQAPNPQASATAPTIDPSPSSAALPFPMTYFAATRTVAPQAGWPAKTYTAVGYCITYLTKTYCWDDGIHKTTIPNFDGQYSYFNMNWDGRQYALADGGLTTDLMTSPTFISEGISINLAPNVVHTVLTTGTAHDVSCIDNGSTLDCGDFQIDLTQAVL